MVTPRMIKIESSNIKEIGYDIDNAILYLRFDSGVYQYTSVSNAVVLNLLFAESIGKFFHKNIKLNYEGKKITEEPINE